MSDNLFSPLPVDLAKGPGGPISMDPMPWELSEVIGEAWEKFKANAAVLIGGFLLLFMIGFFLGMLLTFPISFIGGVLSATMENQDLATLVSVSFSILSNVISNIVSAVLQIGMLKLALAVARGEQADLALLTSGYSRMLPFLGVMIVNVVLLFSGFLLLIVPGVIVALGMMYAGMFVLDSELGVIDAFRASWKFTTGHKLSLMIFGFVSAILMFMSVLFTCGMGMLVAAPVVQIAWAIIYTRISGRLRSDLPDPILD